MFELTPLRPFCLARLTVGPHSYKVQIGVQLVGEVPVRGGRLRKDACLSSRITRVQIPSAAPDTPVVQRTGARLRIWSMQVRVLPGVPFSAPPAEPDRRLLIASRQVEFLCGAPYSRGVVDARQVPNLKVASSILAGSANRACSPTGRRRRLQNPHSVSSNLTTRTIMDHMRSLVRATAS